MARAKKPKNIAAAPPADETVSEASASPATNKAQAVRDFLAANPEAKPAEVVAGLGAQGVEISTNYVSVVKSSLKPKRRKQRRKARAKSSSAPASRSSGDSSTVSLEALLKAKQLADALGGVEAARQAFAALEQLFDE